jgi:hypothetical protein
MLIEPVGLLICFMIDCFQMTLTFWWEQRGKKSALPDRTITVDFLLKGCAFGRVSDTAVLGPISNFHSEVTRLPLGIKVLL